MKNLLKTFGAVVFAVAGIFATTALAVDAWDKQGTERIKSEYEACRQAGALTPERIEYFNSLLPDDEKVVEPFEEVLDEPLDGHCAYSLEAIKAYEKEDMILDRAFFLEKETGKDLEFCIRIARAEIGN